MTKKEVRKKTRKLIRQSCEGMIKNLEKLLDSGAVDYKSADDNFILPKHILCALLKEESFQYKPLARDAKHERGIDREIEKMYAIL